MEVKRRQKWTGGLTSSYYYKGACVLVTTTKPSFFKNLVIIKSQSLPFQIELVKEYGEYYVIYNGIEFSKRRQLFKNPLYTLCKSEIPIAEVHTNLIHIDFSSQVYNIDFEKDEEDMAIILCAMIRLIVDFPTGV